LNYGGWGWILRPVRCSAADTDRTAAPWRHPEGHKTPDTLEPALSHKPRAPTAPRRQARVPADALSLQLPGTLSTNPGWLLPCEDAAVDAARAAAVEALGRGRK